jgi:hypothetical protein
VSGYGMGMQSWNSGWVWMLGVGRDRSSGLDIPLTQVKFLPQRRAACKDCQRRWDQEDFFTAASYSGHLTSSYSSASR